MHAAHRRQHASSTVLNQISTRFGQSHLHLVSPIHLRARMRSHLPTRYAHRGRYARLSSRVSRASGPSPHPPRVSISRSLETLPCVFLPFRDLDALTLGFVDLYCIFFPFFFPSSTFLFLLLRYRRFVGSVLSVGALSNVSTKFHRLEIYQSVVVYRQACVTWIDC